MEETQLIYLIVSQDQELVQVYSSSQQLTKVFLFLSELMSFHLLESTISVLEMVTPQKNYLLHQLHDIYLELCSFLITYLRPFPYNFRPFHTF